MLLSQIRDTVPLKKDKKSQQDCSNGRIITISGQLGCLLFLCIIGSLLFFIKITFIFFFSAGRQNQYCRQCIQKSQPLLLKSALHICLLDSCFFFNLNGDTKFDVHVSSICLILRFSRFYIVTCIFSLYNMCMNIFNAHLLCRH